MSGVTTTEATNQTTNDKIREFETFKLPDEFEILILGSSITARIRTETRPNDTIFHSCRGSSTAEKIKVLSNYPSTELKCVMVQDGTNSILKSKYDNVKEFAIKHQKMIDFFTNEIFPEMIVVCEIPPILNIEEAKSKVDL